jgi:hypothetical protein
LKKILGFIVFLNVTTAFSQKVDSIAFHLYTDSLKKGVHNYINVDGLHSNGKWLPLSAKEVSFNTSVGQFEGSSLLIPANYTGENVVINASLKSNPAIFIKTTVWIKKLPDPDRLPTVDEIINKRSTRPDTTSKKSKKNRN